MAKKYVDIQIPTTYQFEELLSTHPRMREDLEQAVREIMWEARETATERVKKYMFDSAHETHKAIRNIVYRKVIGGELNILNVRRALRQGRVAPSRRGRTKDTERILSYRGVDRGFIFRFANDGTNRRITTNMDGHPMYRQSISERPKNRRYKSNILGFRGGVGDVRRGTIGMFEKEGTVVMAEAAGELMKLVDKIIEKKISKYGRS